MSNTDCVIWWLVIVVMLGLVYMGELLNGQC